MFGPNGLLGALAAASASCGGGGGGFKVIVGLPKPDLKTLPGFKELFESSEFTPVEKMVFRIRILGPHEDPANADKETVRDIAVMSLIKVLGEAGDQARLKDVRSMFPEQAEAHDMFDDDAALGALMKRAKAFVMNLATGGARCGSKNTDSTAAKRQRAADALRHVGIADSQISEAVKSIK